MDVEEFLDITPRFFHALMEKRRDREERSQEMTELMGAQIVAMVRQCGFAQFEKPAAPKDFMPSEWRKKATKPKRTRRPTRNQFTNMMRRTMEQAKAYQDEQVKRGIA